MPRGGGCALADVLAGLTSEANQVCTMVVFAGIVGGIYWKSDLSFQGLQNRVGAIFFM